MIKISERTKEIIESHISDDMFPTRSILEIDNISAPNLDDIHFSRIQSVTLRRALVFATVLFSDIKSMPAYIKALNKMLSTFDTNCFTDIKSFTDAVYKKTLTLKRAQNYKHWAQAPVVIDLLLKENSQEKKYLYVNHCVTYGIIDLSGLYALLYPEDRKACSRNVWFRDISWLTEEAQEKLAAFFFDAEENHSLSKLTISRNAAQIEKLKDIAPSNCNFETFLSVASREHSNSPFFYRLSNEFYFEKIKSDPKAIFSFDDWQMSWFGHNPRRKDKKESHASLNFTKIDREDTRLLAKKYAYYLLMISNFSYGTISSHINQISMFCSAFSCIVTEITQQQAIDYFAALYMNRVTAGSTSVDANNYVYSAIGAIHQFFVYLCVRDFATENPVAFSKKTWKRKEKEIKKRAIPPYILMQIFRVLPDCPEENLRIIFLTIFDTGLRVSDAVSLRKKDLVIRGKMVGNHFQVTGGELHYYCHKLDQESTAVLSSSVAIMLDEYRTISVKGQKNPYFFPHKNSEVRHISEDTFRRGMQDFFKTSEIVTEDGLPYHFDIHSLRHTVAVRMLTAGLPIESIQAQLGHRSVEMTFRYIDSLDDTLLKKNKRYVDCHGKTTTVANNLYANPTDFEAVTAAYKALRAKMLPNGMCKRPSSLKSCPHYCSCINGDCMFFSTNEEYLPIHEEQLRAEKELLKTATSEPEIELHKKTIDNLSKIISSLKGEKYVPEVQISDTKKIQS
jgi:integrase